ncbi:MAG: Gfo/Idh/MocA family oxidoreductase [Blautia sp.]|nr:Gfo/Idh/MocA family oxidoreductase [Blautia sp.]
MVTFAIIGTSGIAKKFVKAAGTCSGCKVEAIYSRSKEKAEAFAKEQGLERCFDDLEALAADEDIDAVYIASPNSLHCRQAIQMMNHGKHVLCEKPLASNRRGVELMFHSARENHVVFMEAMRNLHDPGLRIVKENLHKVGKMRHAEINYGKYSSKYDDFLAGNLPNIFNKEFSTGALMDMGVYCVEPMVDIFGMPRSIEACCEMLRGGIDGEGQITAKYPIGIYTTALFEEGVDMWANSSAAANRENIAIRKKETQTKKACEGQTCLSDSNVDAEESAGISAGMDEATGLEVVLRYSKIRDLPVESIIEGDAGTMHIATISNPDCVYIDYKDGSREIFCGADDSAQGGLRAGSLHPENMHYEIVHFIDLIQNGKYPLKYEMYSKISMEIMDEARRQCGIAFPADEQLGFKICQLSEDIFHIEDSTGVGAVLIRGSGKILLFDTMSGVGDLKSYLEEMNLMPDYVVNSHGHYDHTGGNHWFEEVYLHEADRELLNLWREKEISDKLLAKTNQQWQKKLKRTKLSAEELRNSRIPEYFTMKPGAGQAKLLDVYEGMEFDLGNSIWKVLEFPGHSWGSIALWNEDKRILLSGDAFVPVACLFFPESDLEQHKRSTQKLRELAPKALIAAHYPMLFEEREIDLLLQCDSVEGMQGPFSFAYDFLPEYTGNVYILKSIDKGFGGPVGMIIS